MRLGLTAFSSFSHSLKLIIAIAVAAFGYSYMLQSVALVIEERGLQADAGASDQHCEAQAFNHNLAQPAVAVSPLSPVLPAEREPLGNSNGGEQSDGVIAANANPEDCQLTYGGLYQQLADYRDRYQKARAETAKLNTAKDALGQQHRSTADALLTAQRESKRQAVNIGELKQRLKQTKDEVDKATKLPAQVEIISAALQNCNSERRECSGLLTVEYHYNRNYKKDFKIRLIAAPREQLFLEEYSPSKYGDTTLQITLRNIALQSGVYQLQMIPKGESWSQLSHLAYQWQFDGNSTNQKL